MITVDSKADSTEHVVLSCPEHRELRRAMRMDIDTTCPPKAGAAMAPSADLQVLLGTRRPAPPGRWHH
jgi:hypothetical protein